MQQANFKKIVIPDLRRPTIYRRKCKGTATLQQHDCWAWLFEYPPSAYIRVHSEYKQQDFYTLWPCDLDLQPFGL